MKLRRREFLHLAAGAVALPALSRPARAQAYPARPVRFIVPVAPGGNLDIHARLIGQWLSDRLGQQFIVENRPGGGTNVGTEAVVRAPADGYTLLLAPGAATINATLYEKLSFNFLRDIAPVSGIGRVPLVMLVNSTVPVRTVAEFIAYAKTNPRRITVGSGGTGSPAHLAGELFKILTGIEMTHVPYRGGALALTDLIGGQLVALFSPAPEVVEFVKNDKIRVLAVTTAKRSEALPDLPTVSDVLPGFDASTWAGVGAPKDTPVEIVARLNAEITAGLTEPKIRERLATLASSPLVGSPAEFAKFIADETDKWAKVIRAAGVKPI